jgi:hypothetical protein
MPKGEDDRTEYRTMQLLKPSTLTNLLKGSIMAAPGQLALTGEEEETEGGLLTTVSRESPSSRPALESQDRMLEHENQERGTPSPLEVLWKEASRQDKLYERAIEAVRKGRRTFPNDLKLKVSIAECSLSAQGRLMFRGRL